MNRSLIPWKRNKRPVKKRKTIVIPLPSREDARNGLGWTAHSLEDWMDKLANRVFYAYTTVKLLVQATKEKRASEHVNKHGGELIGISELMVKVVWGWNESVRAVKGFSAKWLKVDVDVEIQDVLLRAEPLMEALENSSSRLIQAHSTWDVFLSFCIWTKDVCTFVLFVLFEILHAFLLFAVSVLDLVLDLILDSSKRKECYTLLIECLQWLDTHYFKTGSVLTKSVLAAVKRIAPHVLVYLGRPYTYIIQVVALIVKKLANLASDNHNSELEVLPKPVQLSAKAARKILLKFKAIAFQLWKPLVTNVFFNDKNAAAPRAKL